MSKKCQQMSIGGSRLSKGPTVSSVMAENDGLGPGFDCLRIILALLILFWHSFVVCYGMPWTISTVHGPWGVCTHSLVPSFFALSGFLVTGSVIRTNRLSVFLSFRILRIIPALVVETLLSAYVIGGWVTTLPLRQYFSSPEFFAYVLNIIGFVHFELPGVFESNPVGSVNSSLWTIPSELSCYIIMSILMLSGIATEKTALLGMFILATIGLALMDLGGFDTYTSSVVLSRPMLVCCFVAGQLFYLWKDRIHLTPWLFALSVVSYCLSIYYCYPLVFSVGAVSITYITVYLGLSRLPRIPLLSSGDYSYGTYLYAWPVQQTVVWLFPYLRQPYFVFAITVPVTLLFAAFSWHVVEKPALRLRKFLPLPQ